MTRKYFGKICIEPGCKKQARSVNRCPNHYTKHYLKQNPDKYKEKIKKNVERYNNDTEYREMCKKRRREYMRKMYHTNPEWRANKNKNDMAWRKRHPESYKKSIMLSYIKFGIKNGFITKEDLMSIFDKEKT